MVTIASNIQDDVFKYLSTIQTLGFIYINHFREENPDLIIQEKKIRVLLKKDKQNTIDSNNLKLFCKDEWRKLVLKATNEIKKTIETRITKGIGFNDILTQINKIEEDLIDITDYEIEWFENIYYSDITPLRQETKERIDNEKYIEELNKSNKEYIAKISKDSRYNGRIDGVVGSLIVGIVLLIVDKFFI